MTIAIILGIVVLLSLYVMSMYNGLVVLRNRVKNAFAQIDVQLKRRYDLIPNLVETVKGYAAHEKQTLEAVISARNAAMSATGPADKAQAEAGLQGTLKSLFALKEAYPELKANQGFLDLQEELTGTEDKIAYSRQYYNDTVRVFNTMIESFPNNLIAKRLGFAARQYFEAPEGERQNVKVSFT